MLNGAVKCIVQRYNNTPVELYYAASPIFIWRVARSVHNHSPFDIPFDIANSAHVSFARYSDCAQTYGTRQFWSYIARPFQSPYDEPPWSLHKLYYNITLYEQNLAHTTYCICYNGYAAHHIMLFIRCTARAHITCWKTVLRRVHKQGTTELSRYHKLCTEPLKMSHNVTQSLHQWNAVPNVTLMSRIVRA